MSEKKSWDVQSKRPQAKEQQSQHQAATAAPVRAKQARVEMAPKRAQPRTQRPAPAVQDVRTKPKRVPVPSGTLKQRRKKKRNATQYVLGVVAILIIGAAMYGLWRPQFRIQSVNVQGPDADVAKTIASIKLQGSYWHVLPRNSIFFYSKKNMRNAILDAEPDISAVSLRSTSFSSLEVVTTARAKSFIWCGTTFPPGTDSACFDSDIEGLLFKPSDTASVASSASTSSSTAAFTTESLQVYSELDRDVSSGQSPLRAHILNASRIPDALKFVGAIKGLGVPVTSLALHDDEADLWIGSQTRITYVLGSEKNAAALAAATLPGLALTNGSIQYVDLRFEGKAYIKKYGE